MADVRLRDLNPAEFNYGVNIAGSLGVGTTSPAEELHVVSSSTGTIRLDGSAVNLEIQAQGSTRGSVGTITNHPLRLVSNNTERVTILSDGNVGIGTTSPDYTLELNRGSGNNLLSFKNNDVLSTLIGTSNSVDNPIAGMTVGDFGIRNQGNDIFFSTDSGTTGNVVIKNGGNVGIGTTAPANLLHVLGNSANGEIKAERASGAVSLLQAQASLVRFGATSNHDLHLISNDDTKVTIKTSGNVGIGTTSPTAPLTVHGPNDSTLTSLLIAGVGSGDPNITFNVAATDWTIGVDNSVSDNFVIANGVNLATNPKISITTGGNVGIGTTSPTETLHVNGNLKVTGTVNVGSSGFSVSSGFVLPFAGGTAPSGWLACSGQAVSRTTYSDLFAIIGVIYGAGDGSTTFNVPDSRGRIIMGDEGNTALRTPDDLESVGDTGGSQTHVLTTEEIPAHKHFMSLTGGCDDDNCAGGYGAYRVMSNRRWYDHANQVTKNTGGGGAHNNIQPSIVMMHIIKT